MKNFAHDVDSPGGLDDEFNSEKNRLEEELRRKKEDIKNDEKDEKEIEKEIGALEKEKDDKMLSLTIHTSLGDWTHDFPKVDTVGFVIEEVIKKFTFSKQGKYELLFHNEKLEKVRTLISYDLKNGDELDFTDLGVGV